MRATASAARVVATDRRYFLAYADLAAVTVKDVPPMAATRTAVGLAGVRATACALDGDRTPAPRASTVVSRAIARTTPGRRSRGRVVTAVSLRGASGPRFDGSSTGTSARWASRLTAFPRRTGPEPGAYAGDSWGHTTSRGVQPGTGHAEFSGWPTTERRGDAGPFRGTPCAPWASGLQARVGQKASSGTSIKALSTPSAMVRSAAIRGSTARAKNRAEATLPV